VSIIYHAVVLSVRYGAKMKIIRQILITFYGIGLFELLKVFWPNINKDWLFIIVFISVAPIIIQYALREYDEWRKEKELEEIKSKKWINNSR
jgi:hypothetical protein